MEAKTEKKGNIIDAFVGGARNGFKIGTNSMVPNIIFGFAVISILNLTGLMEIIGKVFTDHGNLWTPGCCCNSMDGNFCIYGRSRRCYRRTFYGWTDDKCTGCNYASGIIAFRSTGAVHGTYAWNS